MDGNRPAASGRLPSSLRHHEKIRWRRVLPPGGEDYSIGDEAIVIIRQYIHDKKQFYSRMIEVMIKRIMDFVEIRGLC